MVVMLFWGRTSDRIGRKPVLTICLTGMAISTTLFGFSTNVYHMIGLRALAGVFAGTIVYVPLFQTGDEAAMTLTRL